MEEMNIEEVKAKLQTEINKFESFIKGLDKSMIDVLQDTVILSCLSIDENDEIIHNTDKLNEIIDRSKKYVEQILPDIDRELVGHPKNLFNKAQEKLLEVVEEALADYKNKKNECLVSMRSITWALQCLEAELEKQ